VRDLPPNPGTLLVQAQEKLGDAVLLMPFLHGFHQHFPDTKIDILCSRHNQYLFKSLPFIRNTWTYRTNQKSLKESLDKQHYDLFYNPKDHPSITAYRLATLVNAEVKVCLSQPRADRYYNHALVNREGAHIIEKNAELLRPYGVKFPVPNYFPPVSGPPLCKEDSVHSVVAINLSAGGHYRNWPAGHWTTLVETILKYQRDIRIAVFAMDREAKTASLIKEQFQGKIEYPLVSPDLLAAGALLRQCRLFISPDTSLIHVAAAVKTPVIGLYSGDQRNQQRYAPYGVRARLLAATGLSLESISPETVIEAFKQLNHEIDQDD